MPDPASEYDVVAEGYHWIYSDVTLTGEPFLEAHKDVLSTLSPAASLLDCACGIGIHAIALRRAGFNVRGSDASAGMVAQARTRAGKAQADVPFDVCRWEALSGGPYDAVFCCGNAIGHCRNEAEMLESLQGMRRVLKADGTLVLDTRNWEKLMSSRPGVMPLGPRVRNGARAVPVYFWRFPDAWNGEIAITCAVVQEIGNDITVHSHRVTYYPFTREDLHRRIASAGFNILSDDHEDRRDTYRITACPKS